MRKLNVWVKQKIKKFINSRFFLGFVCLIIGITYTFIYLNRQIVLEPHKSFISLSRPVMASDTTEGVKTPVIATSEPTIEDKIKSAFPNEYKIALAIAKAESELNPKAPSIIDKTVEGIPYSIGLFQINLTVSEVAGVNCTKAFAGRNNDARIIDRKLFDKCVELAENPDHNIDCAKKKYEGRGNWTAWGAYNNGAYLSKI